MVFIFGGAYQGKTDFAKEAFSLAEGDIFSCSGADISKAFLRIYMFRRAAMRDGLNTYTEA